VILGLHREEGENCA